MFALFDTTPIIPRLIFSVSFIVVGFIASMLFHSVVNVFFTRIQLSSRNMTGKTSTLKSILNSIGDVIIFTMIIFVLLSYWGIDIVPLLTGAGIAGLAISFGAQTLVKDLISGFFIIVEDQYNVGDVIKIGESEGTVSKITLRLTVIRDKKGNHIYIPNSQIVTVTKYES